MWKQIQIIILYIYQLQQNVILNIINSPENFKTNNCGSPCKLNPQGLIDVEHILDETIQSHGYLGYSPDYNAIFITFRGSIYLKNWISDFQIIQKKYQYCLKEYNCQVHYGFLKHMMSLQEQLKTNFIKLKMKYQFAQIYLTGHSLGAAVAILSLPFIYQLNQNQPIDATYVFGSPKIGNEPYVVWLQQNHHFSILYGRITHHNDPVAKLPPNVFPFQYTHTNNEIYYSSFSNPTKFVKCEVSGVGKCKKCIIQNIKINIFDHLTIFEWNVKQIKQACFG